jgi:hypothetical protein
MSSNALNDLLDDVSEIGAAWHLITDAVEKHIGSHHEADRPKLLADYTIRMSNLHALEIIAQALVLIAQKEN